MKNKALLVTLVISILFFSYFIFTYNGSNAKTGFFFATSTPYLDVKINAPNNEVIKSFILDDYYEWASSSYVSNIKSLEEAKEKLMLSDGMKYSYNADYKIAASDNIKYYIFNIYTFTGGAHGSTYKKVIAVDEAGSVVNREVDLKFIEPHLAKIREDIKSQMKEKGVDEKDINLEWLNSGTEVNKDNYGVVWQDGKDTVIYFGQYQVGAYVFGDFEVKLNNVKMW